MNYLTEILAFTEWKEVNQLPASAIALWYELMAICNKTGWRQEFTVPNGLLQIKAGISRKEFDRARQLLIQAGRIQYKKSGRVNQAGKYILIPFVQKGQQKGQQTVQQEGQQKGQRMEHSGGNERGTLYKRKLKQNINNNNNDNNAREDFQILAIFEKEFSRPLSPIEVDRIMYWLNQDQLSDELILEALKRAVMMGKLKFGYIDAILLDWSKNNLLTIRDIQERDKQFKERKTKTSTTNKSGKDTKNGFASKVPKAYASLEDWAEEDY
ncbi:DnaD domain protein [Peptococcaceae bacterium 1198_IL3148]